MDTLRLPRIFLHFFDLHFLELMARRATPEALARECRRATRLSYLSADQVLIPAASYFESELCRSIVDELSPLFDFGVICLVGGGLDLYEFFDDKQRQYPENSPAHRIYYGQVPLPHPPFLSRRQSTTKHIKARWGRHLDLGRSQEIFDGTELRIPAKLERNWDKVPERLGGRAFIVDNVLPLLIPRVDDRRVRANLHAIVNEAYFESYTLEYGAGVVRDLFWLNTPHCVPSQGPDLPYQPLICEAEANGLLGRITDSDATSLALLRNDGLWGQTLAACLARTAYRAGNGSVEPVAVGGRLGAVAASRVASSVISGRNAPVILRISEAEATQPKPQEGNQVGPGDQPAPSIGIITALPKEFAAVEVLLQDSHDHAVPGRGAGRRYTLGNVVAADGTVHRVVVALMTDMGNNPAAIRATLLLEHFPEVESLIMPGIAGGVPYPERPDDHVRLGDIVVSNRNGVIQYDNLKSERREDIVEDTVRAAPRPPSAKMLEAVNFLDARELRGNRPWEGLIDQACPALGVARPREATDILHSSTDRETAVRHPDDRKRTPGRPRLFRGPIAAANILLKDPIRRDRLRDAHGVKAVEMEGSGIADATWHHGEGYLVVRGICDYCDMSKGDDWQAYAAVAAAAYTVALIGSLPAQAQTAGKYRAAAKAASPCRDKLAGLDDAQLRRLITDRMGREEIAVLWHDTLGGNMADQMADKSISQCVIELISRARQRNRRDDVVRFICSERPDLAE